MIIMLTGAPATRSCENEKFVKKAENSFHEDFVVSIQHSIRVFCELISNALLCQKILFGSDLLVTGISLKKLLMNATRVKFLSHSICEYML